MAYTTINKGSSYFNTITYTGTGASLANTGVGFQPDWVWIKGRSGTTDHGFYDAVRGVQKQIESNTTTAETTETTGLTAFGSDGFTVGALAQLNTSAATYVSWNWLGANTTVSNTSGSITSTVSANTTSGFSIVSWAGSGANATVGHGLGTTPAMIITKSRTSGSDGWYVLHQKSSSNDGNGLFLNNSSGVYNRVSDLGGTGITTLSSSTFTINQGSASFLNMSSENYIAYCFAEVKGFSKFGSYTGNGSATEGTFVYTGFKPRFLTFKGSNLTSSWVMFDTVRSTINPVPMTGGFLLGNLSNAEAGTADSGAFIDILSNGFKIRNNSGFDNDSSSAIYIYIAFAENPFVTSGGIPVTAR
jgi:hypothetical protein